MNKYLARILGRNRSDSDVDRDAAWRLYFAAVSQARTAAFYTRYGVADTIDGRFDLIILHVILLIRRLRRDDGRGPDLAQALFDATFADMDRSLREMGVGDLGVGRRVKAMAKAYFGRAEAYDGALDAGNRSQLVEALDRNVLGGASAEGVGGAEALADYVQDVEQSLAEQRSAELQAGKVLFAPPAKATQP